MNSPRSLRSAASTVRRVADSLRDRMASSGSGGSPICTGCVHDPVFDVDDDGDVDQDDFGFFQTCITGPNDPDNVFPGLSNDCKCTDRTGPGGVPDNAIDQQDVAAFEECATGPDIPIDITVLEESGTVRFIPRKCSKFIPTITRLKS